MTKITSNSVKFTDNGSFMEKLSYQISSGIGKFFYNLGKLVALNPWKTIIGCWISVGLCSLGFLNFYQERDPLKLWVPDNIDFLKHTKFIMNNFQEGIRTENVMIVADNVLKPEVFQKLRRIIDEVYDVKAIGEHGEEVTLQKLCFKVPLIAVYMNLMNTNKNKRRKRQSDDEDIFDDNPDKFLKKLLNPSFKFTTKQYCSLVNRLKFGCMHENILEMWKADMKNLTESEILDRLHTTNFNQITGHVADFKSMLGGIEKNLTTGEIISAKSLVTSFNLHLNFSEVDLKKVGNMAGTEDWATVNIMHFESEYLKTMARLKKELETEGIKIYYAAGRSYGDISAATLFQEFDKLFLGAILMMIYMLSILSKFSWVELRFHLTSIGILNVGMAYASGCGLSSFFLFYSPVHSSLFFIILGLGVDDIFVIMAAIRKIQAEHADLNPTEKIARAMQKAGASITVTSLTDIIAFLVGGTTVLPSLRSFCVFAALCILMTYLYVVTFFVAVLTLDERRVAQKRNGFMPCIKHESSEPVWEPKLMLRFLHNLFKNFILTKIGKVTVICMVIGFTAIGVERLIHIKQKFDPMWFIPSRTYFYQYVDHHRTFYPNRGYEAGVYMGHMNYSLELPKLIKVAEEIKGQKDILSNVQSWPTEFQEFMYDLHDINVKEVTLNDTQWGEYISKFLFSVVGGRFQENFKFKEKLECGKAAGDVLISSITFNYHRFSEREEFIPARDAINKIIKSANFTNKDEVFLWGKIFGNWFTDEIIDEEIYRNIVLALIGVFVCTAIMIVNVQVCLFIFLCVLLSLISVGGFMQMWGLTLDIVTSIGLQLSVGLCIDYAAHIGHTFLTISGDNGNERALLTVETIGGAVLQGGGSTTLAILLLATSDAYTFKTFFKIFTIVVIFGLFYGTVFLPVLLSIFNPRSYSSVIREKPEETQMVLLDHKSNGIKIIKKSDANSCDSNGNTN